MNKTASLLVVFALAGCATTGVDTSPPTAFRITSPQYADNSMLAQALLLGGHVRVGLEDNYYLEKGVKAPHNAALVEKAVTLMRTLGAEPATPAEAREILGMGKLRVA